MEWPLLQSLAEEDRRRVLSAARLRRFARNEVIFHEGDPGDTMHLISKGRVAVRVTTAVGSVATLTVLGSGEYFGELTLLSTPPRTATIVALEATETFSIHREQFAELERTHPSVNRFLVNVLAAQVTRLSGQVLEALYVAADDRVLGRLADLADIYGDGSPGTKIPLTQDDLATMAGTSRATVNRVLREAQDSGLISLGRMKIEILAPERLARKAR